MIRKDFKMTIKELKDAIKEGKKTAKDLK